nr:phosphopantetheine-binding protein [Mycolicibacterium holsaticum]
MTADPHRPLSDSGNLAQPDNTQPVSKPQAPQHHNGSGDRGPADAVEQVLADIYAQVLNLDSVGVDESFFDLGGDSLTAMRAVAAINAAFDIDVSLPTLLAAPSVRSLGGNLSSLPGVQIPGGR